LFLDEDEDPLEILKAQEEAKLKKKDDKTKKDVKLSPTSRTRVSSPLSLKWTGIKLTEGVSKNPASCRQP